MTLRFTLVAAAALAALPLVATARPGSDDTPVRAHRVLHHHRHALPAHAAAGLGYGLPSGASPSQTYATTGDKSGYPGGNEFDPTAPFGGQAAVTAPPGTPAYDEQMNQRRYFCEYSSNRC